MCVCFRLISLLCLFVASIFPMSGAEAIPLEADSLTRTEVRIARGETAIGGLCLMKRTSEEIRGSVINQFGIRAFDFVYHCSSRKVTLKNLVAFLDKWYIRRTLKGDLSFLFSADVPADGLLRVKRRELRVGSDSVELRNLRRQITYTFTFLKTDDTSHEVIE